MDIQERAEKFKAKLIRRFPHLLEIGSDPSYVAYILAYTEFEKERDAEFLRKRKNSELWKDWKRVQKIVNLYPGDFQKRLLLEFAREVFRIGLEKSSGKFRYFERMGRKPPKWEEINSLKLPKKPPEWYLDRAILDLGSYFEAISSPDVKRAEERRQYQLIADLLYDFGLFKQELKVEEDESEIVRARVVKRAEAIPAKKWKDYLQGVKESLGKIR